MSATFDLAVELIRRRSLTPDDAGCQEVLATRLRGAGFQVESLPFGAVSNLWARRGKASPLFAFVGHTDVVPTGPERAWRTPPFEPRIDGGYLYGRGAADMKGSLAAMTTACERFAAAHPEHGGSIALLITSDEEGPARDGTARVVARLADRHEHIAWCLVGEPSSQNRVGDTIKNGRRGSLNAHLLVRGVQGHVAYPQLAENPIHRAAPALAALAAERWDAGNEHFPPTSLQISNIRAGTGADNVIPGELDVRFNFRYATASTQSELERRVADILDRHGLDYSIEWSLSGAPFLTPRGALLAAVVTAVRDIAGQEPQLSTAGGTSDGRFVAPTGAEVVELGPVNATIHKVDERVAVDELDMLSQMYERVLEELLATE